MTMGKDPIMLLEVRSYTVNEGKREAFVDWFDNKALPVMKSCGIDVLGQFTSTEDENTFVWLRSFADEADKDAKYEAFYGSDAWTNGLAAEAKELVSSIEVKVVSPTEKSAIH
jgi:hypothetical protein